MNILVIKTGASGDVLRTTPVLRKYKKDEVDWFVDSTNSGLLPRTELSNIIVDPSAIPDKKYDLVISLEDDAAMLETVLAKIQYGDIYGAYIDSMGRLDYSNDSQEWFDLGIISKYGISSANELKLKNRESYQEILFRGLGFDFHGEEYFVPPVISESKLRGDIAIAPKAGNRWPSKNWPYFQNVVENLSKDFSVNILPFRETIHEHIADVANHKVILSGDSLPMHVGLGLRKRCVTLFFCTSPWEIYEYGRMKKLVSPLLSKYFYTKEEVKELTQSISIGEVLNEIKSVLA